jgi:biotin operon repressor
MDDLIRRKATGAPEKFAERLGIKKTMLMEELQELRALGAQVAYCKVRESYYYLNSFVLKIGIDRSDQKIIKGGQAILLKLPESGIGELKIIYFHSK